jgi:hypothetical protein
MLNRIHHFIKNINNNKIINDNIIIIRKMTTFTSPSGNNNNNKFLYIFVMVLGFCISHKFDKKMKT